jgi:translation initiation factor IF-2
MERRGDWTGRRVCPSPASAAFGAGVAGCITSAAAIETPGTGRRRGDRMRHIINRARGGSRRRGDRRGALRAGRARVGGFEPSQDTARAAAACVPPCAVLMWAAAAAQCAVNGGGAGAEEAVLRREPLTGARRARPPPLPPGLPGGILGSARPGAAVGEGCAHGMVTGATETPYHGLKGIHPRGPRGRGGGGGGGAGPRGRAARFGGSGTKGARRTGGAAARHWGAAKVQNGPGGPASCAVQPAAEPPLRSRSWGRPWAGGRGGGGHGRR